MNRFSPRTFAIVPAAGRSDRMGTPKLLLPWRDATILDHVLKAWTESLVSQVVVVIRAGDQLLETVCRSWPIDIVRPASDPRDMKQSIQIGLHHVEAVYEPGISDRWMAAPADLPDLTAATINAIVSKAWSHASIVLPRYGNHRGHPVSFPWAMANEAQQLGEDEGIDRLLALHPVRCVDFPCEEAMDDIDTPADYRRLSGG